jgi:hypothetical protein
VPSLALLDVFGRRFEIKVLITRPEVAAPLPRGAQSGLARSPVEIIRKIGFVLLNPQLCSSTILA